MSGDLKVRRKALGLSRGRLAELAHVDKRILQLIEIARFDDHESISRVERVLDALEAGEPVPDFEAEIAELVREHEADTLEIGAPTPKPAESDDEGSNGR